MSEEAKSKILSVIPFLRDAMAEAKAKGVPHIGILCVQPDGGGRVVAKFRGEEFVDDLCAAFGVSAENTEDERLDVAAARIVQMVKDAGGTIASEEVPVPLPSGGTST